MPEEEEKPVPEEKVEPEPEEKPKPEEKVEPEPEEVEPEEKVEPTPEPEEIIEEVESVQHEAELEKLPRSIFHYFMLKLSECQRTKKCISLSVKAIAAELKEQGKLKGKGRISRNKVLNEIIMEDSDLSEHLLKTIYRISKELNVDGEVRELLCPIFCVKSWLRCREHGNLVLCRDAFLQMKDVVEEEEEEADAEDKQEEEEIAEPEPTKVSKEPKSAGKKRSAGGKAVTKTSSKNEEPKSAGKKRSAGGKAVTKMPSKDEEPKSAGKKRSASGKAVTKMPSKNEEPKSAGRNRSAGRRAPAISASVSKSKNKEDSTKTGALSEFTSTNKSRSSKSKSKEGETFLGPFDSQQDAIDKCLIAFLEKNRDGPLEDATIEEIVEGDHGTYRVTINYLDKLTKSGAPSTKNVYQQGKKQDYDEGSLKIWAKIGVAGGEYYALVGTRGLSDLRKFVGI